MVSATVTSIFQGQSVFLGSGSVLGLSGLPVNTSISGNMVAVSGTVTVAGAVTTSISGNYINFSGTLPVSTSVSGNAVSTSVSGNVVAVSGTVAVAGAVTTSISAAITLTFQASRLVSVEMSDRLPCQVMQLVLAEIL